MLARIKDTEMHEELARDYEVPASSNRKFGFVVGGILLLFACVRAYLHGEFAIVSSVLAVCGSVLIVGGAAAPGLLEPANRGWMRLGLVLHKITNPIFLGLIYGGAFVPVGLLMRAFGVDPMGRRSRSPQTNWIQRSKKSSTTESLKRPF
jgi:hypothetical protein